jgi:hypothetical protein
LQRAVFFARSLHHQARLRRKEVAPHLANVLRDEACRRRRVDALRARERLGATRARRRAPTPTEPVLHPWTRRPARAQISSGVGLGRWKGDVRWVSPGARWAAAPHRRPSRRGRRSRAGP